MAEVKPATKTVKLYVGGDLDLVDEYDQLQAAAANPTSLAGPDTARLDEIRQELQAATMVFRFRALGRRRMQKLLDDNPPRKDKPRDQLHGFNEETATDALIRKCLIEPDLSDQAITDLLEDQLTDGQYEQLSDTVWALNRRAVDVPFSWNGSSSPRSSAAG
jgi:hypothetical protein